MVWHDHGNEGNQPVMWLDGLDIPLLLSLQCMFFEEHTGQTQPVTLPPRHSEQLFGRCLFPAGTAAAQPQPHSPVWTYRWTEARAALAALRQSGAPDPFDGVLLRYVNPATGGEVLPTLGCRLQLLPRGFQSYSHRHTASTVYHVAEGSGWSLVGEQRLEWQQGDTFAVPIWCQHQHAAEDTDAILFSFTDEPVLRVIGQYREHSKDSPSAQ
jgi:gentisate 1,2-dioxygenase